MRASLGARRQAHATSNRITGNRRWWALGAVLLTMFFSSLDQTVVSTAMPVIIGDLQGFSLYAWVFTAYMITSAVTVPIYGKLSDVYGRKPFYIFGLVVFMIGSALSGQAHDMLGLILFRALQGVGAGAMLTMPRASIGDIFNPRERGRWMGVLSSVFAVAMIVGPLLGGWITDSIGWRWVFYINLPVALVALIAVSYALPSVRTEGRLKLDWLGSLLLALGLVPALLAFSWAGSRYPWSSAPILGLFGLSVALMSLFWAVERHAAEPVLAPELLGNRIFTSTAMIGFLISLGMFGSLIYLPVFIQGALGESALRSGQVMMPMMLSFIVGSVVGGQLISRTGRYRLQAIVGTLLMALGTWLLTRMGTETPLLTVIRNMIVIGLGIGAVLPLLNVVVQNAFPYKIMGMVNATQQFVRSLGGIIAAPILGTVLANTFATQLAERMPSGLKQAIGQLPPAQQGQLFDPQGLTNAGAQQAIRQMFAGFGRQGPGLYHQFIELVRQALAAGTAHLFTVALVFAGLAFLAAFFLRELPLQHDEFFEQRAQAERDTGLRYDKN
ncbi:MAG TPA: DHA2 family efflux MFS transporter permease subunit [Candidatus Fraserbacteria bacterium]|nr:DHA2 family efflux MFS transporter permease subunit [Candidatus Fraserbacteria bacterium]